MSMLPFSIWTQEFSPSSRHYNSIFDVRKPIIEWVYELATSSSEIHEHMRDYSWCHGCQALGFAWTCHQQRWFHWGVIPTEDIIHVSILLLPSQYITDGAHSLQYLPIWCYPLKWHRNQMEGHIKFVLNQDAQWFAPAIDGYATLATSLTLAASQHVPAACNLDMVVLGVTVALCLIFGISTAPLDHCCCTSSPIIAIFM